MALPISGEGGGGSGPVGAIEAFQDVTQGAAPGGEDMSADLPMSAVSGQPATTNGFSPQGGQPPLPPPGSDEGSGKAPGSL